MGSFLGTYSITWYRLGVVDMFVVRLLPFTHLPVLLLLCNCTAAAVCLCETFPTLTGANIVGVEAEIAP